MKLNYNNIVIIIVIFIIFVLYIIYDTYSPIETFTSEDKLSKLKNYVQKLIDLNNNEKNIRRTYRNSIISFRNIKDITDKEKKKELLKKGMKDPKGFYSFSLTLKKYYETQNNILNELIEIIDEPLNNYYFIDKKNMFNDKKENLNTQIITGIDNIEIDNIDSYDVNIVFDYEYYKRELNKLDNMNSNIINKFEQYELMNKEKFTKIQDLDTRYNFFQKIDQILKGEDDTNKLDTTYLNMYKEVQTYELNIDKILRQILDMLNRSNINVFDDSDSSSQFIKSADNKNQILLKYCKKLKLLDKPKNTNLITKRFNKEYIDKKNTHIKKLEEEMIKLQTELFETETNKYNAYKLRTDDQSRKQYNAILKGIDNIKNSNKLKLNIV